MFLFSLNSPNNGIKTVQTGLKSETWNLIVQIKIDYSFLESIVGINQHHFLLHNISFTTHKVSQYLVCLQQVIIRLACHYIFYLSKNSSIISERSDVGSDSGLGLGSDSEV